jgi:putative endonuclease
MIRRFTTPQQKLGEQGEDMAVEYLNKHDYILIERNYSTKDGEIDIICIKDNVLYFIEVKTTSLRHSNVLDKNRYKPEYNVSREKLLRMRICSETYVFQHNVSRETCFGVVLIEFDDNTNTSHLRFMRNIIIDNQGDGSEY